MKLFKYPLHASFHFVPARQNVQGSTTRGDTIFSVFVW